MDGRHSQAHYTRALGLGFGALTLLAPLAVPAQSGTISYYVAPTLVKHGANKTAVAGAGVVVLQVYVKADGSFKVQRIIKSSNHGDDAAALEIANSSTYKAASRGGKPLAAFYDYTLRFSASGAANADSGQASTGGLALYERQIRAGNYGTAQSGLKAYVAAHPSDLKGQADLGVAAAYLNDLETATAAFDKAGTIPDNYKAVAAKAYADSAAQAIKNKDAPRAVAAAKRAVALAPGVFTYNALGTAEAVAGDGAAAIADLEKARSLAAADAGVKPADRARIDVNLLSAYLDAGKMDMAKQIAAEVTKLNPNETSGEAVLANYYVKQAQAATTAGKPADAAAAFEQAAAVAPSQAVALYSQAAFAYLNAKPKPDNDKAKADADKALAASPDDASANFAAGVALANQGKGKDALTFLNKADASAKKAGDANLVAAIENIIKQLGGSK
ncbi:MAG: energy transducer TonB [Candidatus Eremiobacteraeota bacterium]|nr:energy transducer TonB [Candidatus Eremiobacteraeota bacterium]